MQIQIRNPTGTGSILLIDLFFFKIKLLIFFLCNFFKSSIKNLDQDPCPDSVNPDPKHWISAIELALSIRCFSARNVPVSRKLVGENLARPRCVLRLSPRVRQAAAGRCTGPVSPRPAHASPCVASSTPTRCCRRRLPPRRRHRRDGGGKKRRRRSRAGREAPEPTPAA
jgi:hypothetical protein